MYRKFTRSKWGKYIITTMQYGSGGFWAGSLVTISVECTPLDRVWDPQVTEGRCLNMSAFYIANASIMIGMDMVLYMLPIAFTCKLNLPRAKKVGLNVLFGLGCM
jgi:hypothetical protein